MPTTLKFTALLVVSVTVASLSFALYQTQRERQALRADLSSRAEILATSLQEAIDPPFERGADTAISRLLVRFAQRDYVKAIAIYDAAGVALNNTPNLDPALAVRPAPVMKAVQADAGAGAFFPLGSMLLYAYGLPLHRSGHVAGSLGLFLDADYIEARVSRTLRDSLVNAGVQVLLTVPLMLLLVRWNYTDPLARMTVWLRTLRAGEPDAPPQMPPTDIFHKLHDEMTHLAHDLGAARASAESEARLRESQVSLWTAERLRVNLRNKLQGRPLFIVSNREPYMHTYTEHATDVIVPASGLVTALEPVLLACDGTWIAHGAGSADRAFVDEHDRLRVPPDRPSYTLRRVWLTENEENGYYYGFSNEGLWPLCHIAHTRPIFRPEDWTSYQDANRRFADAVLEEMADTYSPVLLAQDYHFALLPRLVKEARPDARVAIFWHIPWPNPEAFGICPWSRELVDGLLGADLIGFHTQSHCNNFLETVDRSIEALTEWDRFAVNRLGHVTSVRPYPISVAFPEAPSPSRARLAGAEHASLCEELGLEASTLIVGVDRVDYTKGILERFRAVERLLDECPSFQRRVTLVQIGAPSRTQIDRYQQFFDEVAAEAARINARFGDGRWRPIALLNRHHTHQQIARFFRAATACLVTSLHDGMNLVAKEFVAAREDNHGVLILSTFTGAALELTDALLVNPYDIRQVAGAIRRAIEMSDEEQAGRMRRMRLHVRDHNVYRWAATLLTDLVDVRVDQPKQAVVSGAPVRYL
jgi:trehalose 6-phosphate synthase